MQRVIREAQTLNKQIKVYQQYHEHMGHKVITVGANG